ncbi:hypothetical protein [Sphingomonas sp. BK580]|uniref:hypothetical protein n=1 Tax=Sphingomonas sp. BK580 TaxID=2586972 RepID=UPI0016151DFF|nr:hypothetical protein [Sphingomonas sp. BK580]MBB3693619.1 hypothetical protein [Sphingomonas sp. BK580]
MELSMFASYDRMHLMEPDMKPDEAGYVDPVDADRPSDRLIVTTERRLRRMALVAADTGARFEREGVEHEPLAWMLAPRELFLGARPIDACQNRDEFLQATLLHRLSLGLDARPEEVNQLLEVDEIDEKAAMTDEEFWSGAAPPDASRHLLEWKLIFFSCMLEGRLGTGSRRIQAFCGLHAEDEQAARGLLRARYGSELAASASIMEGFDPDAPIVTALLSDAIKRMLSATRHEDACGQERDFHFVVEQQFSE